VKVAAIAVIAPLKGLKQDAKGRWTPPVGASAGGDALTATALATADSVAAHLPPPPTATVSAGDSSQRAFTTGPLVQ
jgi:hypothetical protein